MPFGALVRSVVPEAREDELIRYRTINNQGVEASRNLRDTIITMRNRQDWARDEMIAQGFGENLLVGSVPSRATADELASHIRGGLSLAAGWCRHKSNAERFRFLRGKSSDAGLMVMVDSRSGSSSARRLDVREFRAFVLLDDGGSGVERKINQAVILTIVDDEAAFRAYWKKMIADGARVQDVADDCARRRP